MHCTGFLMEIGLRLLPVVELPQVVCSVEMDNLDKKNFLTLADYILYQIQKDNQDKN